MSYGTNRGWGADPVRCLHGPFVGQNNTYFIDSAPGATLSIYQNEPVYLDANGYIKPLRQSGTPTTQAILGIFQGCEYIHATNVNIIAPAGPKAFWAENTKVLANVPVVAMVVDDPMIICNIQSSEAPIIQANVGATANFAPGDIPGDDVTGVSLGTIDPTFGTAATANFKVRALVTQPGLPINTMYNNVEVVIQNHFWCSRPAGIV